MSTDDADNTDSVLHPYYQYYHCKSVYQYLITYGKEDY